MCAHVGDINFGLKSGVMKTVVQTLEEAGLGSRVPRIGISVGIVIVKPANGKRYS